MQKKWSKFLFVSLILFIVGLIAQKISPVYASGTPTQNLKVVNTNGTMFVTTTTDQTGSDPNTVATPSANGNVTQTNIIAPPGFATDIGTVINFAIRAVMVLSILLVFGSLIWGGVSWITSGGDKTKTEGARNRIVAAIIGLLAVSASYAIIVVLVRILGFQDLTQSINILGTINSTPAATASASIAPSFNPKASGSPIQQEKLVK